METEMKMGINLGLKEMLPDWCNELPGADGGKQSLRDLPQLFPLFAMFYEVIQQ